MATKYGESTKVISFRVPESKENQIRAVVENLLDKYSFQYAYSEKKMLLDKRKRSLRQLRENELRTKREIKKLKS